MQAIRDAAILAIAVLALLTIRVEPKSVEPWNGEAARASATAAAAFDPADPEPLVESCVEAEVRELHSNREVHTRTIEIDLPLGEWLVLIDDEAEDAVTAPAAPAPPHPADELDCT